MGKMARPRTTTRIGRLPTTFLMFCLAFLSQVDWSLSQAGNDHSALELLDAYRRSLGTPSPSPSASSPLPLPGSSSHIYSPPAPPPPSHRSLSKLGTIVFSPTGSPVSPLTGTFSPTGSPPPPGQESGNSTPTSGSPGTSKKSSSKVGIYVGVVAAIIFAVVALCAGIILCRKKRAEPGRPPSNPPLIHHAQHHHAQHDEEKMSGADPPSYYEKGGVKRSFGTRYPYSEINKATNGFSQVLGRGAFGVVYKGKLADGTDVAVKKLLDRERGLQDFSAEMKTLGRINHANLVALRGFCFDQNQPYVIYEYVANGSLDKWIFQSKKEAAEYVMPWKTRVSILKGTAKGLAYLHEDLQIGQAIIHLDVKSENILLDEQFVPKVADFGLAKLLGSKLSHTLAAGGTMGYMAPEVIYGAASPKMDVYSFGVVLLEVVSGRRVMVPSNPSDSMFLPGFAVRKILQGNPLDVIDPLLEFGEFDESEAVRLVMAGLLCLQRDADDRPGMSEVIRMIDGSIVLLGIPDSLQPFLEMAERLIKKNFEIPVGARGSTSSASNFFSGSSQSTGQNTTSGSA